jgi:hypothetical protein
MARDHTALKQGQQQQQQHVVKALFAEGSTLKAPSAAADALTTSRASEWRHTALKQRWKQQQQQQQQHCVSVLCERQATLRAPSAAADALTMSKASE